MTMEQREIMQIVSHLRHFSHLMCSKWKIEIIFNISRPFVALFANVGYIILVRIGIVKRVRIMSPLTPAPQQPSITPTARKVEIVEETGRPTVEKKDVNATSEQQAAESQRRKELAKRALEKRMASKQQESAATAPGDVVVEVVPTSEKT
jgi:hypothetical protein